MEKLFIRRANINDLKLIQWLNHELFLLEKNNYDSTLIENWPLTDDGANYFKDMINNHYVSVAIINNEIVGYLAWSINEKWPYEEIQYGELNNMFIKDSHRWDGIGKKLIDEFKEYCKENGIYNVKVIASYNNKNAINFYKKNWFTEFDLTLTTRIENFAVRKAMPSDAYWIAFVNAHTWYETYKWLVPEKVLKARIDSINERAEKTREFIENGKNYLVVENLETKEIIWMLIYWLSRNEAYPNSGEIMAIYVLPQYQKLGLGKKLFLAWINELINLWYNDMIINVLKWNNAINFYKKYGGKIVWEKSDQFGKKTLYEDIMHFDNLASIK